MRPSALRWAIVSTPLPVRSSQATRFASRTLKVSSPRGETLMWVAGSAGAVATKAWVHGRLRELTDALAAAEPIGDPGALAYQLAVVVEGVYASAQALGAAGPARRARAMAETLMDAARPSAP